MVRTRLLHTLLSGLLLAMMATGQSHASETVRVVYNSNWPPFSEGANAGVGGILPGLMRSIVEDRMGWKIENSGASWPQAQAFVKRGRVDAMVTVATDERLAYSHANDGTVFALTMRPTVRRGGSAEEHLLANPSPTALQSLAVCDIVGNGWAERFYATNNVMYVVDPGVSACLERISQGGADVIVQPPEVVAQAKLSLPDADASNLITLDHEFARMEFRLLISNKSNLDASFVESFDAALAAMTADGSYDRILKQLSGIAD